MSAAPNSADRSRIEAATLAMAVITAYEAVHDGDIVLRACVTTALDMAGGRYAFSPREIDAVRTWAVRAAGTARYVMETEGPANYGRNFAAYRAAEAVLLSLAPDVDLEAVRAAVRDASRRDPDEVLH